MATFKWGTVTFGSNIASTILDGLPIGNISARIPFNNETGRVLYARPRLGLAAINTTTGASVSLGWLSRVGNGSSTDEDILPDLLKWNRLLRTGNNAKVCHFPWIIIPPTEGGFIIGNYSAVNFASSGNTFIVDTWSESDA